MATAKNIIYKLVGNQMSGKLKKINRKNGNFTRERRMLPLRKSRWIG